MLICATYSLKNMINIRKFDSTKKEFEVWKFDLIMNIVIFYSIANSTSIIIIINKLNLSKFCILTSQFWLGIDLTDF